MIDKPVTTPINFLERPLNEAIESLMKNKDDEKIELTVGELRQVLLNCLIGERSTYTAGACAVEQFILKLKMRKP